MKTLLIHFRTGGYCSLALEVPDDYQVTNTHPGEFWKDLQKKLGKKNVPDIWKGGAYEGISQVRFDGFYIDNMVLDYLQRVFIYEIGKEDIVIDLEHIPLHR